MSKQGILPDIKRDIFIVIKVSIYQEDTKINVYAITAELQNTRSKNRQNEKKTNM